MPVRSKNELRGPIEDLTWARKLPAHVFTDGLRPRLCGFDLYGDLAQNYRASDLVLTGLRGEPPTEAESELFDAILTFLAPVSVGEAPTHGAVLSRLCGAAAPSVTAVGAAVLAHQAADLLDQHVDLLRWLASQVSPLPTAFRCQSEAERGAVGLLAQRVRRSGVELPILSRDPSLVATLLAACHQCGLTDSGRLQAVIVIAKLPGLLAETLAATSGDRQSYPIDLPAFRYVHDDADPAPEQ